MSNIAGKAYAMNVITPSEPQNVELSTEDRFKWWDPRRLRVHAKATWLNRGLFMLSRGRPSTLTGLLGLSLIHFARWFFVRPDEWPVFDPEVKAKQTRISKDYMIFCSNFNGTWDQYIDAFSDGIPNGLNLFWYSAIKYPRSIPITSFKDYIVHNQIDTDYYYNATPGSAQRDVKGGMRVMRSIHALQDLHAETGDDPERFAKAFREELLTIQSHLGDAGFGPVASLDTEIADINRRDRVHEAARIAGARNQAMQMQLESAGGPS